MTANMLTDRHAMAQAVRIAVWGKAEDIDRLRPKGLAAGRSAAATDDDPAAMAAALAAFGLKEDSDDE